MPPLDKDEMEQASVMHDDDNPIRLQDMALCLNRVRDVEVFFKVRYGVFDDTGKCGFSHAELVQLFPRKGT